MEKNYSKHMKTKSLRCRYPIINMRYNQFNPDVSDIYTKHIDSLETYEDGITKNRSDFTTKISNH